MAFRAFERNSGSEKKSSDSLGKMCLICVFKFCMLQIFFRISNELSRRDIHREKNSSRCDDSPKKKNVYAVHALIWKCSVQNKFSTWNINIGECFCVNFDILKHSVAMSDPCENWESTPGIKRIVCESRARMKLRNFYAYCLLEYLPNKNWLFQMCVIVFVSATI